MTLLVTLSKSGHIANVETCSTPGLASQKAREYVDAGIVCRVVPDELKEDIEYLMGQIHEKRENGFIEEYGIVPNGTRSKGEGARGIGRMIFPAVGGLLEGREGTSTPPKSLSMGLPNPPPLTISSKSPSKVSQKILGDLILPRRG